MIGCTNENEEDIGKDIFIESLQSKLMKKFSKNIK